jgi:hypothetical protein
MRGKRSTFKSQNFGKFFQRFSHCPAPFPIVQQLKTVVDLNIPCMVFKELYFLKTKVDKHKKNNSYVHIKN